MTRIRLLFSLLFISLGFPSIATAYPCFYELNAPVRLGTGQSSISGHVDLATGAFIHKYTCNTVLNPGICLEAAIVYRTQDNSLGPFGPGTSCPYDWFVTHTSQWPGSPWVLIAPGNIQYVFDTLNNGMYTDPRDPEVLGATLNFNNQPTGVLCTLTWKEGTAYQFDNSGGLIQIADRHSNVAHIARNSLNGFVASIYYGTNTNRWVHYVEDSGSNHVTQIQSQWSPQASGGTLRRWYVGYDLATRSGKMLTLSDPASNGFTNSHTYHYTWTSYTRSDGVALPLLATVTDRLGMVPISLHYDTSGRVVSTDNPLGSHNTYSWSAGIGSNGTATGTGGDGHSITISYTWAPNLFGYYATQKVDNTLSETTAYSRAAAPTYLPTGITDFRGRTRSYTWDVGSGDLLSVSYPILGGGNAVYSFQYDPVHHVRTQLTDPAGRVSHWTVDATGNILTHTTPANDQYTFTYDSAGQILSMVDPMSHHSTWTRDSNGCIISYTDAAGKTATYTVADVGLITGTTDPMGSYTYYGYDLMFNRTLVSKYPNQVGSNLGTAASTSFGFDAERHLVSLTDALNNTWTMTYDCCGNPLTETDPMGHVKRWTWDSASRLTSAADAVGNKTQPSYRSDGRVSSIACLRLDGSMESHVDYNYDPVSHQVASIADSLTGTTSLQYDGLDELCGYTTPNGSTTYQYDSLGRPAQVAVAGQNAITYGYDLRGDLASLTQGGQTITFNYDSLGRLTGQNLPNGVVTEREYDPVGLLDMACSSLNGVTFDNTTYTHDAARHLTATNANGMASTVTNDPLGRTVAITNSLGDSYNYTYLANGLRSSQVKNGVTTNYLYNNAGTLTTVGGTGITRDANGNPTAWGGNTYTWNTRGQLINYTTPGTTLHYAYDGLGNPLQTALNGVVTNTNYSIRTPVAQTTNGVLTSILNGPSLGGPIQIGSYYNVTNGMGSTTKLVNGSGGIVGTASYNYYGMPTQTGVLSPYGFGGILTNHPTLLGAGGSAYSTDWGLPLNTQHPSLPTNGQAVPLKPNILNVADEEGMGLNISKIYGASDGDATFGDTGPLGESSTYLAGKYDLAINPNCSPPGSINLQPVIGQNITVPMTDPALYEGVEHPLVTSATPQEGVHVGISLNRLPCSAGGPQNAFEFRQALGINTEDPGMISYNYGHGALTEVNEVNVQIEGIRLAEKISINTQGVDWERVMNDDPLAFGTKGAQGGSSTSGEIRYCLRPDVVCRVDWYEGTSLRPQPVLTYNVNPEGAAGEAIGAAPAPGNGGSAGGYQ